MHRDIASEPGLRNASSCAPAHAYFPLTIAQTPIVLDALALPDSPVANTGDITHIRGHIDTNLFAQAVRRVVAETEAIRVSLSHRDGMLRQSFLALDDYDLERRDFSIQARPERAAEEWIDENFWTARPWNSFPLFHFALLKIGDDHFVFAEKFHHVLADATGRFQCFKRIAAVYEALVQAIEPAPTETQSLTVRIEADAAYLASQSYQADLAYWTKRLANLPELLVDSDRGKTERGRSGRPARVSHSLSPGDFARLKGAAASLGSSVPRLALALTSIAISRLYGRNDIVIGTPTHNRITRSAKQSIDLSMTVMPFRMNFAGTDTIARLVEDIALSLTADREHGRFSFASLARPNMQSGTGLYDVIFNYIPAMEPISLASAEVVRVNYSAGFYAPLTIDIRETPSDGGAILTVTFDHGLIERDDGVRLARCLQFLLTSPADLQQHTVATLPLVSEAERHHQLVELNDNDVAIPADATLASICADQARRTPDAVAATCGTQAITYAQLHAKAETLALRLAAAGAGPEIVVGVALPRNIDLIVTLLAIHKAGGAYLPLDTTLPAERIAYMVGDAKARLIATTKHEATRLPQTDASLIYLDDPRVDGAPEAPVSLTAAGPENLAYVIYTSGSTGMPKGVAVEHRNAVNLALSLIAYTPASELDGILFSTALSFDVSLDQLFMSLAGGGRMIIVDSLLALPAVPAQAGVRIVEAAPSVFEALLQIGGYHAGPRLIRFCGEALPRSLVDRVLAIDPDVRIENAYGPTETTVYASIAKVGAGEPSIGTGLWNTQLYVLDRNRQLLPKGAKGELYIGGAGVARGYLNRPDLTAERFLPNPFGKGRIYRTGDIVRWRQDGALDYFSRMDDQVKINGLRVELGEIERQLETLPEIAQAVVVVRSDDHGAKRIFAFAIPRDSAHRPDLAAVNRHLQKTLPKYMTPAALSWVDEFPLTGSGKLDRKALSLPSWRGSERAFRAPANKDEIALARIWSQILGIPKIGVDDDFFDLGGTSLQAVMIFAKISRAHGFDLPASTMARAPTIAAQAALLNDIWRTNDKSLLVTFREKGDGAPLFFVHGGGGGVLYVRDLMRDLRCANPLYGLHAPPLDGTARLPRVVAQFAAAYAGEIRKVQPQGPYHLIGFSAGGTIAYEIARQLQEAGETTALLGLIETNTGRYQSSIREARAALLGRIASRNTGFVQAAKLIYGSTRKAMKRMNEKTPNELRHALGLAIPHDEREYFYMRWFRDIEADYAPGLYRGPVTLFASQPKLESYRTMWSPLAVGGLIVHDLPEATDHSSVVQLPNSRFLAARIDASLSKLAAE
jgi:enterobactin synthetase component F